MTAAAGRAAPLAFLAVVVLGGFNSVGVRLSNLELAPLWGATLRFVLAAGALLLIVALRGIALPRGRAFVGSVLYGVFAFAGAFGFIYWALVRTPAGVGQVVLALVPLLTLMFAVAHGIERFRLQGFLGALVALAGIAIVFAERMGSGVPVVSLLAVLAGAASMAESNVIAKLSPKCNPVANNAVAMTTGAIILFVASALAGESRALPADPTTWAAVLYVALAGSVAVFSLFVYLIQHWTASRASYVMLLMPLVTVVAARLLIGEPITPGFLVGGAFVLAGVYVGAFARPIRRPVVPVLRPERATVAAHEPVVTHPGCA